jgi:hypothetical protein
MKIKQILKFIGYYSKFKEVSGKGLYFITINKILMFYIFNYGNFN